MKWIIFPAAQLGQLSEWNAGTEYQIRPRLIDNAQHGSYGDLAAPQEVVSGPYTDYWEEKLADHVRIEADADDLFAPSDV